MKVQTKSQLNTRYLTIFFFLIIPIATMMLFTAYYLPKPNTIEFHNMFCPDTSSYMDNTTDCTGKQQDYQIWKSSHCQTGHILGIIPFDICK